MVLPILDFRILASRVCMRAHALVRVCVCACVRAGVPVCVGVSERAREMLLRLFKLSQWLRTKAVYKAFCLLAR